MECIDLLTISYSYTLTNCLPFDIKLTLPNESNELVIKKSEKIAIENLSYKYDFIISNLISDNYLQNEKVKIYDVKEVKCYSLTQ